MRGSDDIRRSGAGGEPVQRCSQSAGVAPGGLPPEARIDKDLLDILACPACRGDVRQEKDTILCVLCGRRYPIRDGIPVMLVDESEPPGNA